MSDLSSNKVYQSLAKALEETNIQILAPGLDGYEESIKRWSEAAEKRAAAVAFPKNVDDVSKTVKAARQYDIEFVICCGRHSTGGASSIEDGLVIDLCRMNKVTVDETKKILTVEGGCTWETVDVEAAKFGLATVGGTVNHTGVGGLILGGGFGWLSPRYGLAVDNLLSAQLVLADGSIVRASNTSNQDLFWAIRGAGSSFAVATEFVLQAYDQPNSVWAGVLAFTPDKLQDIIKFANKHHETAGENEALTVSCAKPPPEFQPVILAIPVYNGPEAEGKKYFEELLSLGPVLDQTRVMPYEQLNGMFNFGATFGDRKSSGASAVKYPLDYKLFQEVFDEFLDFVEKHPGTEASLASFYIIPYKKICLPPLESTAYANRGEYYNSELILRWTDPEQDQDARTFNRYMSKKIRESGGVAQDRGVGAYPNNVEHQVKSDSVFGVNTARLVELKKVYDPDNVFRKWHDILLV